MWPGTTFLRKERNVKKKNKKKNKRSIGLQKSKYVTLQTLMSGVVEEGLPKESCFQIVSVKLFPL